MADTLDLGNLLIHLKADISQYESQMRKARGIMNKVARNFTSLGTKMSLGLTLPLAAFGFTAVKAFGDFDQAMRKSTSIMRGLTDDMKGRMADVATEMSTRSVTSAKELAGAYEFLALAGLKAETQMKALPLVNKFAIAGAFDMAQATDLLTDAQDALRMSSKDTNEHIANMAHLADSVAFAATQANDSIQGFATMLTRDAGVSMTNLNMELKTGLAILSAYASQGIKGAQAGNMFGRATRLLTKAARENGKVWEKVGIDVINETTGEYRNFIDILGDLEEVMKSLTAPDRARLLDELGFAALAQKSILPLIGMTEKMRDFEKGLEDVGGTVDMIAKEQLEGFNAQLTMTKNLIGVMAKEVGGVLAPIVVTLNGHIKKAIKWFRGLSDENKKTAIIIGVVAAALGPVLLLIGLVIKAISIIMGVLSSIVGLILLAVAAGYLLGKGLWESFAWIQKGVVWLAYVFAWMWEGMRYNFEIAVLAIYAMWEWLMNKFRRTDVHLAGKMLEKIKKGYEERIALYGEIRDTTLQEIDLAFKEKENAKKQKEAAVEEQVTAKEEKEAAVRMDVDDMLGGDGLTTFGTGEAIGELGLAGLTIGAENVLENLEKQSLAESKKQTDHLANIEENTEWE